jgi:hypothetical protein
MLMLTSLASRSPRRWQCETDRSNDNGNVGGNYGRKMVDGRLGWNKRGGLVIAALAMERVLPQARRTGAAWLTFANRLMRHKSTIPVRLP